MTPTALMFAVAGQICFFGLLASQSKPAWFRVNGQVPSRLKIGATWAVLIVVCALGAVASDKPPQSASTEAVQTESADQILIDIALPGQASSAPDAMATDAQMQVEEASDGLHDASMPADAVTDIASDAVVDEKPAPARTARALKKAKER